jgi:signal peptidase I
MQNVGDESVNNSSYDASVSHGETPTPVHLHVREELPRGQHSFFSLVLTILVILAIAFGIRFLVATPYLVDGASMEETFHTYDYLIVDRLSYRLHAPQRGDVIVLKFPLDTSRTFIKRIIGLPGETVVMHGQAVMIKNDANPTGFILSEPYISAIHSANTEETITLKAGQYFVMGDNRKESADSRYWGILPAADIIGPPILRIYPFNQINIYPGQARYSDETATSTAL